MRDEQVGQAEFGPQPLEQVEDLGLDEDVQGRHRLVADDQGRVEGDGARDGDPLGLAAGQLAGPPCAVSGQPDQLEHLVHPLPPGIPVPGPVGDQRLLDEVPHPPLRVQRAERVLEDHLQVPPGLEQPGAAQRDQVGAAEDDRARGGPRRLHDRAGQRRLARTGLAHDAQRLPGPHVERDAGDGVHGAEVGAELVHQVFDLQRGVRHRATRASVDGVPAGPAVAGLVLGQRRRGGPAVVGGVAAARLERAARWRRGRVGRPAADHRQRRVRRAFQPRDRLEQRLGVRHPDAGGQFDGRGLLDDPAGVHHDHLVGVCPGQAEIVADEHEGHAEFGLELEHQLHDLRLGGHVQRGGRLVGDEQPGAAGQRDRDHHALPHPAGQLVRVLRAAAFRQRHVHQAEQVDGLLSGLGLGDGAVGADGLGDLRADPHRRVQRPGRVLEHHRHVRAAMLTELIVGQADQLDALEARRTGDHRAGRQQPHQRAAADRLAGPGLAHDGQRLPGVDGVGHPVDRAHLGPATAPGKSDPEVLDVEKRLGHLPGPIVWPIIWPTVRAGRRRGRSAPPR